MKMPPRWHKNLERYKLQHAIAGMVVELLIEKGGVSLVESVVTHNIEFEGRTYQLNVNGDKLHFSCLYHPVPQRVYELANPAIADDIYAAMLRDRGVKGYTNTQLQAYRKTIEPPPITA